jgi:hypothetical protein
MPPVRCFHGKQIFTLKAGSCQANRKANLPILRLENWPVLGQYIDFILDLTVMNA